MSPQARPSYQKRIGYHATLLGAFATLSTMALLLGDLTTRDAIAQRKAEDLKASLTQVIPQALYDNDLLQAPLSLPYKDRTIQIYRGFHKDRVTALAFQIHDYGYAGEISLILGIDTEGKVLGVRVLSHAETPGLGDKMEIKKSDWITGFAGLSRANTPQSRWAVKKDGGQFDQFTGATITPRAIVRAVKSGLDFFHHHEQTLIAKAAQAPSMDVTTDGSTAKGVEPHD